MTRPEQDRPEASAADERFWQAFAQAAGFEDELRELVASGEIDGIEADLETVLAGEDLTASDLLAADRLHELLLAARVTSVEPAKVELAPRHSAEKADGEPRRQYAWLAALSLVTLASVAAVATALFFGDDGSGAGNSNAEVASAERLAEEWVAVREELIATDVVLSEEVDVDAEPAIDAFGFEETPDWLVLVMERQAELAEGAVEEATP